MRKKFYRFLDVVSFVFMLPYLLPIAYVEVKKKNASKKSIDVYV